MIPNITHPAGELIIRKLNDAAANMGSFAAQLDGQARTLLTERDSQTGLDGFRTAFGEDAPVVLDFIRGFRQAYKDLTGHDVPPLDGQSELTLPQDSEQASPAPALPTIPPTEPLPPAVGGEADQSASSSAPAEGNDPALPEDAASETSDSTPPAAPAEEPAGGEKPKRRK